MFQVGQVVVVKSSGLRRRVIEIIDANTVMTASGDHHRAMKVSNLTTPEAYAEAEAARISKLQKRFGKR